jgi:hypothetical protein
MAERVIERVIIAERKDMPDEGGVEQAIFIGPDAERRPRAYLIAQYGGEK